MSRTEITKTPSTNPDIIKAEQLVEQQRKHTKKCPGENKRSPNHDFRKINAKVFHCETCGYTERPSEFRK